MSRATFLRTGFPRQRLWPHSCPGSIQYRLEDTSIQIFHYTTINCRGAAVWAWDYSKLSHFTCWGCHQPPRRRPQIVLLGLVTIFWDFTTEKAPRSRLLCVLCMKCIEWTRRRKVECVSAYVLSPKLLSRLRLKFVLVVYVDASK
jgi:hypothetical protein